MNRLIHLVLYLHIIVFFISCGSKEKSHIQNQEKTQKPNIVFLFADDQRNNSINALGNNEIITPNLDRLVNEGSVFSNAYNMGAMVGAVCAPSRAMVMTGRSLFRIDPTGNTIDTLYKTLPKALENDAYHTFHIGKWHNGRSAFGRSFEDGSKIFFGGMHSQYNVPTYEFEQGAEYSIESLNTPSEKHSSELYADAGIEFLQNYNSDKPFFMYIAFQAPHDPREMPQKYLEMYDAEALSLPSNFQPNHPFDNGELDIRDEWLAGYPREPQEIKANIAAYYAMVTHLDEQIGRVFKTLEEKNLMENTIIVFAGDNGLAVGQHGLMGKQNLYEHSINVPLIFKGPGIPKGKKYDSFTYLYDIYPTLCDLAGAKIPVTVEGISLKPILTEQRDGPRKEMLFAYKNFQRALRKDHLKLIKYNVKGEIITQLFNLKEDPYENKNLADNPKYKSLLDMMTKSMEQVMVENNDEANINEKEWGVPVLQSWKDKVGKERARYMRGLAEEERKRRGF